MNANAGIFPKKDIAGIRKLKVQCLAKKSRIARTICEDAQFEDMRCLIFSMNWMKIDMQSSCGMFEHENVTSAVTKSVLLGSLGRFTMKLRKIFVSLMCDGKLLVRG